MGLVALPPALITGVRAAGLYSVHCLCDSHYVGLSHLVANLTPPCPAAPSRCPPEYCSRGNLYDCLAAARQSAAAAAQLTWRRRLAMAVDAGTGLLYLHRRSIIHRDGVRHLHVAVTSVAYCWPRHARHMLPLLCLLQ